MLLIFVDIYVMYECFSKKIFEFSFDFVQMFLFCVFVVIDCIGKTEW